MLCILYGNFLNFDVERKGSQFLSFFLSFFLVFFNAEDAAEDFRWYIQGSRTGKKAKENAQQASSHVARFCQFMSSGLPHSDISSDLTFLKKVGRIRRFQSHLHKEGYVPSTMKCMLNHISGFITHLEKSPPLRGTLDQDDLQRINYELKKVQRDVRTHLPGHLQKVQRQKTENQLTAGEEVKFMADAREKIPTLFGEKTCSLFMLYSCILLAFDSISSALSFFRGARG